MRCLVVNLPRAVCQPQVGPCLICVDLPIFFAQSHRQVPTTSRRLTQCGHEKWPVMRALISALGLEPETRL